LEQNKNNAALSMLKLGRPHQGAVFTVAVAIHAWLLLYKITGQKTDHLNVQARRRPEP
jgi:hypothetical protein